MNGKIKDAVTQLAGTYLNDEVYMVVCTVTAVDVPSRTCTCTTITGAASTDLQGVQLMAEVDDGLLLLPTVGSTVVVSYSKQNVPYVALYSQIDKVVIVTGNSSITMTDTSIIAERNATTLTIQDDSIVAVKGNSTLTIKDNGYSIVNGSVSLTDIMKQLLTQILALTVTTGTGPSGTPINSSAFQGIQTNINNILI
jgi:hypothetical protein